MPERARTSAAWELIGSGDRPWWRRARFDARALPLLVLLFLVPVAHPLFRPALGPPSHLLWWVHVVPVAYVAYTLGLRGAILAVALSGVGVWLGESTFGAGYGTPAADPTIVAITVAVVATNGLVAAFALWIRHVEAELRRREHFFRDLFVEAPIPYFSVGVDGTILRVNRRAEALLGAPAAEIVGRGVLSLYADKPEGRGRAEELLKRFREGHDLDAEELLLQRADGEEVWISLSVRPVRGPDGEILESRSVPIDISEQKAAEAQVQRLAAFPKNNPNPVVELAQDGSVNYANEACWQAVRRLEASGPEELLPTDSANIARECLETGIGRSDLRTTLEDRSLAWVYHPVRRNRVVLGYAFDITFLDEQLRHLQKMEAVGRFSGGIAHDFNNLLSVILANCGLLHDSVAEDAPAASSVRDIETAATRGADLVNSLLAFSRRQRLKFDAVPLGAIVREMESTLALLLSEKFSLEILVSDPEVEVRADRNAVEQMVVNLVSNAAAAMPDGGVVTVEVLRRPGASVVDALGGTGFQGDVGVIAVRDRGVGIPRELQQQIFEPFFSTKGEEQGTGMGLAMVHGLMQQHGGAVELDSELGEGTTMELVFPLFDAEAAEGKDGPGEAPELLRGVETVLLVDDEEALRRAGKRALEGLGYRVLVAGDGVEAEEIIEELEGKVDLVITDMVMPRRGGQELWQRARERWPHIPFLFTSGYSSRDWGEGVELGADVELLPKPWTLEELSAAVRKVLAGADEPE